MAAMRGDRRSDGSGRQVAVAVAVALGGLILGGLVGGWPVGAAEAAVPRLLNAQGVIHDAQGAPAGGVLPLTFSLYGAAQGGAPLWSDPADVAVSGGVFTTVLGDDPLAPFPADLFTGGRELWLEIRVASEPPLPRQRLVSVPFALEADRAAEADVAARADAADEADVAAALDCAGCVGVQHLDFVPASQADIGGILDLLAALEGDVSMLQADVLDLERRKMDRPSCAAGEILVASGSTWVCRADWATQADVAAARPTSVDGLSGGTITSGVAVGGSLSAVELVQSGHLVCDASGNCGQSLANVTCDPDQILKFDGSAWVCAALPREALPPAPCAGPSQVLQWDGSAFACVDIRDIGPSGGSANGYEVRDAWGYTWDAVERGASTWDAANAACLALGGRLPTATELFRNNATSGTGNLGTVRDTTELWTAIPNYQGNRVTVRVSDGAVSARGLATSFSFRCVWPDHTSDAFEGDYCYGPPGQECTGVRRFYNMDRYDRPALDFVAASHECNFYNGSLPAIVDWAEAIHEGQLTGDFSTWLWATGAMYHGSSSYVLHPMVKFSQDRAPYWTFDNYQNAFASWAWPTTATRFRCIGKRDAAEGVDPEPACAGGCFAVRPGVARADGTLGRRAPLWADRVNRTGATRAAAAVQCEALGGSLPTLNEFQELIHAGLPFDTGANEHMAWLWTASPIYHGNYQNLLARRSTGADQHTWYAAHSGTVSWDSGATAFNFRCVWHQTFAAEPISCAAGQVLNWDGGAFACADGADGDAGGAATDGGWTDDWANVWDRSERAAGTNGAAAAACQALGGRLPTPTELHRVRNGGPNPIPNASTNYLWTNLPSYRANYTTALRLSDGAATDNCTTGSCTNYAYRCIWPSAVGTVFGARACAGHPGSAGDPRPLCARTDHFVTDAADRARVYAATATRECLFYGGTLSDLRDMERVIHGGAPNGDWSRYGWILEPMYASYYRLALLRWSGVGTPDWYWNNQGTATATLDYGHNPYPFRCVFTDVIR
jgi:hypothetical protein